MRALVIGEALIDIVERDGKVIGEHVGGSPLNVAVGLARLGRGVDFLTHIGDDDRGRSIVEYVESSGAQLVSDSTTADRTPTARATLDENGSAQYVFDIDWQLSGTPEVTPPLVAHTGSIATWLEPGCRATAALLLEKCDVVKASDEDLRWIDPNRTAKQIARTWLSLGPSIVAVTMGDRGAFAMCEAGTVRIAAMPLKVVDTVGAGDAFMTGLIDALWELNLLGAERRHELRRIGLDALNSVVRTAALSSALTVTRAGADLPDRATRDAAAASSGPLLPHPG
jgi:fructokinase